jgi:hypothetical protein
MKHITATLVLSLVAVSALGGGQDVVRRGAAISPKATAVSLDKVLASPADYAKKPVIIEGVISQACSNKGCWIELSPAAGKRGVRITFKDYGFFVPLDSKGMQVRAEGVTKVKTLSKKEADHLAGEGASLVRSPDGTAREVSFVANGVELRR